MFSNFAFNFGLRRYNTASSDSSCKCDDENENSLDCVCLGIIYDEQDDAGKMVSESLEFLGNGEETGAYTRPDFSSTRAVLITFRLTPISAPNKTCYC